MVYLPKHWYEKEVNRLTHNGLMGLVVGVSLLLLQIPRGLTADSPGLAPIDLSGPEVTKLDWNTRALTLCDLNGDERLDFAVINNNSAKIDLLLQRDPDAPVEEVLRTVQKNRWEPVLEDARFRRESIVSGDFLYALAAGDLNDDGRTDFAYTGNKVPLTVRYQGSEAAWKESWEYEELEPEQWISTLQIADLNSDRRNDLIVLAKEKLFIFYQNQKGGLREPKSYSVADENNFGLQLVDLNNDGLVDLFYALAQTKRSIRLRLQYEDGDFGPEIALPLESATSSIRTWPKALEGRAGFAFIQSKTRHLEIASLHPSSPLGGLVEDLQPTTYSSGMTTNNANLYTMGDFNGDGLIDLAAGDSREARVLLFWQKENGIFSEPIPYPSLSNLSAIFAADFSGQGRADLVVLSSKEGILGYSRYSAEGRLEFPEPISVEGAPITLTVEDIDQDGRDDIVLVEKIKKKYRLTILLFPRLNRSPNEIENDQLSNSAGSAIQSILLDDLNRDPEALFVKDFNGDGLPEITVLIPREAARIFVQKEDNTFEPTAIDSAVRKSLLTNLDLSQLGLGDLDGDGLREILVGSDGFARSLRLNEKGSLEITDQYNARRGEDKVRGPLVIDINSDGAGELLFYDEKGESIQVLERDETGVYRYQNSFEVGKIDLLSARSITLGRDSREHIFIFGNDRFWVIPMDTAGWEITTVATYETDLKDIRYTGLDTGDFDGDGNPEIIALDAQNHVLEILREVESVGWSSALHFTVFDENPHYRGRKGANLEPRELVVGDLTGDGLDDIALLIHDRALFYIQN